MPSLSSWREILNPEKGLTKLTEAQKEAPFVSIVSPSVATRNLESSAAAPESTPLKSTDKTDKSLTQEEAEAVRLLSLFGVRIMRTGSGLQIGIWEDLDSPELRAALHVTGLDVHPIVHLESAEVPIRYKVRSCPDRNPGESFAAWRQRALTEARRRWGWTAQPHPPAST